MTEPDTTHRREAERGGADFDTACAIIDAARICHLGVTIDDHPYVLPMACARHGDQLLIHGSVASRLMKALTDGAPCCATITHLDGLVLARSAFHSSMNYRCVMVFGRATELEGERKRAGLNRLTEHLMPGRLAELRESTRKEIAATRLLALGLDRLTTKVRTGPPEDPAADLQAPVWAGVAPMTSRFGPPEPAPGIGPETPPPAYLRHWR